MSRPTLLILSFSDIENDARVMKQVRLFADRYEVTTCGFGAQPDARVRHVSFSSATSPMAERLQAVVRRLRSYGMLRDLEPYVRHARKALKGKRFDAALVNDPEGARVAYEVVDPSRVHMDLHEFYPGLHDDSEIWVKYRRPYYEWMLRHDVSKAATATTVSQQIADRYSSEYGISCGVVHNALPYQPFEALPVGETVRIVHSGGAQPNRRIEVMMEAVARSSANISLDLFLTGEGSDYAATLRGLAERLGDRVNLYPPKPYAELLSTLNGYDIGIHILPPTNTNNVLALPNKLFDYVQARLGVVVGPTEAMAERVRALNIGAVADGFDVDAVVEVLDRITPELAREWKAQAVASARQLSVDAQLPVWEAAVASLIALPGR